MATVGLDMVYVGLKNPDGTVITGVENGLSASGVFPIDTNKKNGNLGTKSANITGLAGTINKISGNNQTVDVTSPIASPSVAIDANRINNKQKNMLLSREQMDNGGWVEKDEQTEVGMIVQTRSPITMKSMYVAFGRGFMSESGINIQTNTDTAQTREDDNLTYTALSYSRFNGKTYAVFDEEDESFDIQKVFDAVFPGNLYDAKTGGEKKA